jgi:small GTP-binding protein
MVSHPQIFALAHSSISAVIEGHRQHHPDLNAELRPQLEQLEQLQVKLKQQLVQIAAFGLVSRGKSAVLNALYGEKVFHTGPLNGVTQWPRSIRLPGPSQNISAENPSGEQGDSLQIELVDTPGLDEVAGAARGEMAKAVAQEADLILFISAGLLTPTELQALSELAQLRKPIVLVLNKHDLYPDLQPEQVHAQLQASDPLVAQLITPQDMVMTIAAPAPLQVRQQWPDGRCATTWETAPVNIQALQEKLAQILQAEGSLLATTHVLCKAEALEQAMVTQISQQRQPQAEKLIWQYSAAKALGIALSGWLGLDLLGGVLADLLLVRGVGRVYGFPLVGSVTQRLWPMLLRNFGLLLCSDLGSGWLGHWGGLEARLPGLAIALIPMGAAAYGAYQIAQVAQAGLQELGVAGTDSPRTCLQTLGQDLPPQLLISRTTRLSPPAA